MQRNRPAWLCATLLAVGALCVAVQSWASVFGTVRGIVHDPLHRPLAGASVKLKSATSDWSQTVQSGQDGAFSLTVVPLGDYVVTVTKTGFESVQQTVTVASDSSPILHFQLTVAPVSQKVTVSAAEQEEVANVDSVTPTTLVARADVAQTPGADRTNSLQMITDYVPGAYVTHDMLHMRGGHQVDWLIDGVPIPNTNIATNLGPQIDPKDIDYLEVLRGSYDSGYGDRTYGIFNLVPRTGFERNNEAELITSFGNWYQTNDQFNFGGHTERFAYYASLNGNRSNYGLQTPIGQVDHDADNGYGGFASFLFNLNAQDQLRLVTSLRQDYYQIPVDPDANSAGNQVYPSYGLRDGEHETDGYVAFSWVHTFNSNLFLTVSPFYHYSKASYQASPNDVPVITNVDQTSNYGGLQATLSASAWKNDMQAGLYGFAQRQSNYFNNFFTQCPPLLPSQCPNYGPSTGGITGGLEEIFVSDKFKVTTWLTLIAGFRQSHFTADIVEDTVDPRYGVAVKVPRLNWVFRAFYGDYYQAPPLLTATGPLLALANSQNLTFARLHGERDEEHQFGVTIPYHGWVLDADTFQTRAKNWLDHSNIGESNLFWPLTWDGALIQGWELTLRSPRLWRRGQFHLAYSNQIAQARGPFTGGLICPSTMLLECEPPPGYAPVDHDQRNTLNLGFNATLPWQAFASTNVYYGSGFTNGMPVPDTQYPGNYLPGHTTFDLSFGKSFTEKYTVSVTALNVGNRRVLLDNSLTFGGFHYNDPREIYVEFRYRFHY
ncbi:MAG TPA: TonB-dependent receptor [Candidatus Acidoferrales bacterium]|nr:TonB-dependent receptor [Candidatus Acidoferrales bacterium]